MELHGNLNLLENEVIGAVFKTETNFPVNPKPGRFCFKDKVAYFCTEILEGLPVWVPFTQQIVMIKHSQPVAALEWTINHGLNTNTVFVQVFDEEGKWVIPDAINTGEFNVVRVTFNAPTKGIAIMQRGVSEGSAPPLVAFDTQFALSDTWVVNHGLGYNPIIRCIIGVNEVQPASITYDNLNRATVTFNTPQAGSVRCI